MYFLWCSPISGSGTGESKSITKLFEEVAADARKVYLGSGSALMNVVVFGFPRNYKRKELRRGA